MDAAQRAPIAWAIPTGIGEAARKSGLAYTGRVSWGALESLESHPDLGCNGIHAATAVTPPSGSTRAPWALPLVYLMIGTRS